MIWLLAAAVLLILVFAVDRFRPLPKTAMIVLGTAFVAAGFLRLAYVQWDYLSAAAKPLDTAIALDRAATIALPPFDARRAGQYDVWLQTDRPSPLYGTGCNDPGYDGEKPCPDRRPLDLRWAIRDRARELGAGATITPGAPAPTSHATHAPSAIAGDQTPVFWYLGTFAATDPGPLTMTVEVGAPDTLLAARHPRLIVGLSGVETAPAGLGATLFCVLCVLGGGFMLLKALVPRKASS